MKRSFAQKIALTALAGVVAATAAHATEVSAGSATLAPGNGMFQRFDIDSDGKITRDEATRALAARFARMDADGDGTVTRPERASMRKVRQFKRMDTNRNGSVTLDEMERATLDKVRERFARLDADGNGSLTLAEAKSRRGGPETRNALTLQDLDARVMRMFDRADRNRDGTITPDEASSMRPDGQRN